MTRKEKRKTLRLVQKHLNELYNHAESTARSFDRNSIPLATLRQIVSLAYFATNVPAFATFATIFNKALDSLYAEAEQYATANQETRVPLTIIRELCDEFIRAFKEGQAEQ